MEIYGGFLVKRRLSTVKIRPFRYGNKLEGDKFYFGYGVKIRPFRYGNHFHQSNYYAPS